jgi:hypothetical protein
MYSVRSIFLIPKTGNFRAYGLMTRDVAVRAILVCGLASLGLLPSCQKAVATPDPTAEEIWEVFYLQNAKIGYGQTTVRRIDGQDQPLVDVKSLNHLEISRFGQRTEQDVKMSTLETPDGQLLEFATEMSAGPAPVAVSGRVENGKMVIEIKTKGRQEKSQIPWSREIGGFRAIEQSLSRKPPVPGEKRSLKMLMPLLNQVADVELAAGDRESTSVLGVEVRLLRVDVVAKLPGNQAMNSTVWTDSQGKTIKTRIETLEQESFRTTREVALAPPSADARFDLGSDLVVKLPQPLADPHHKRLVRYRIELAGGDPAKVFASGPTQSVQSLGEHTAIVTVTSLRPGEAPPEAVTESPAGKEYLTANSVLQIDDPRVQQAARNAKGDATDPAQVALALEGYVHSAIAKKNFSQAFSTAAEVAESREGDCTEHAVLLAALARACGIPSRVAIGLVYVESAGGFGYHMWTEMYLGGVWTPLDAIMGQGGIGAAHLKLTDSSLEGATAYSSFLPVAQVVGKLKISVVEAD